MRFGAIPVGEAAGAVLAHSVRLPEGVLKKGRILTSADLDALMASGLKMVIAARLESGDVGEDEAAQRIGKLICGANASETVAFTGRSNLKASVHGVALIDRERLIELNSLDEGLTVATVAPFDVVAPDQLVATVKIIPFALPGSIIAAAELLLQERPPLVSVAPFAAKTAALVLTRVAGTKVTLLEKRTRVLRGRLEGFGSRLDASETVAHDTHAVRDALRRHAAAGADPILVFGASAIVDRGDVIPQALSDAGGEVIHLGMPVDPGNLLMVGKLGNADVIGVPSCATSPKLNGFDWVLARLLAGLPVGRREIVSMAPGGLLMEIPTRPQPRGD